MRIPRKQKKRLKKTEGLVPWCEKHYNDKLIKEKQLLSWLNDYKPTMIKYWENLGKPDIIKH